MRYEPVGYIIEYEVGALIVFLIIMFRYLRARRFPNQKNSLYTLILWTTLLNVWLDISSSHIIENVFNIPPAAVQVVNTSFYASSVVMLILMTVYTLALTERLSRESVRRYIPLLAPGGVLLLLLLTNPVTRLFFYVSPEAGYVHGKLFISIYIISFVYLILTFLIALRRRKLMHGREFATIMCFLAVVCAATVLQYLVPRLLATGVAIIVAVSMMYFTIQNPDVMRDITTNTFTYEAMLTFLSDCLHEKKPTLILAVKIKNMSRINDLLGVDNGSLLLRQVSEFLASNASDVWVFRMRGSTFAAITRSREDYENLGEALRERIPQPWVVNRSEVMLQATICHMDAESLSPGAITSQETVNYLETALLSDGKDGVRITHITAGADLVNRVKRERLVEAALRKALQKGEGLQLYFQPLWSMEKRRFTCAEVLLRFRDPVLGSIPPDEFVPIAESRGLVTALDEFVIRRACAFLKEHDHCRALGQETLEINLSALEFMQHRLPELLRGVMAEYGVDPEFLCFEITETAATLSFELLRECMEAISALGCRFALDDFGTGYANISQVISLPFSTVKLDKSLLHGPPLVLRDMTNMFSGMNCATVIEGVETAEQVELVRSFSVSYIQGFYYARPMNESDYLDFLKKANAALPSL